MESLNSDNTELPALLLSVTFAAIVIAVVFLP
jgi:hypothetical protein